MMHNAPILDIQNNPDLRNIAVNRVGIRRLKHPVIFEDITDEKHISTQNVVAQFDMLVDLPKHLKGTHMSRFVEILNEQEVVLSVAVMPTLLSQMIQRLGANNGYIEVHFPYFIKKYAPVSKAASLMDYEVCLTGKIENGQTRIVASVIVPVTSLCPCSKEIADYGAHNQRSHVTVSVDTLPGFSLWEIIQLIESKASCELYGILKRADEKEVTERAYNNPKFVEDLVRDIATSLEALSTIKGYKISSENFESIHNHSAFAEIDRLSYPQLSHRDAENENVIVRTAATEAIC